MTGTTDLRFGFSRVLLHLGYSKTSGLPIYKKSWLESFVMNQLIHQGTEEGKISYPNCTVNMPMR